MAFTIKQAISHKRLEEKCRRLLRECQRQAAALAKFNRELLHLDTDGRGTVNEPDDEKEVTDLLAEIELAIKGR